MSGRADKLHGLDDALVGKVKVLLAAMDLLGHPMIVTDGYRTPEAQAALFAQGRTTPGRIVTYADGTTKQSRHQSGRAVDCTFLHPDDQGTLRPCWCEKHPWLLYGEAAKALGLRWGGEWRAFPDRPHLELP